MCRKHVGCISNLVEYDTYEQAEAREAEYSRTWAGELAQQFKVLAALAEDPGSVASTYTAAHKHP